VHAPDRQTVDRIHAAAPKHGWYRMFASVYPHAGGTEHYAAYLEDAAGFEVEIVADGTEPAVEG
jgi:hypothetical protein